jgi:hypothetical protein
MYVLSLPSVSKVCARLYETKIYAVRAPAKNHPLTTKVCTGKIVHSSLSPLVLQMM